METTTTTAEPFDLATLQLLLLVVGDGVYATETLPPHGSVVVGRSVDADVRIDDASISRSHARIHLEGGLRIEDLGSANGTWVRDQRLKPNQPHEFQVNEPLTVGAVTIIVQRRPRIVRTRRLRSHDYFESRVDDECALAARSNGQFAVVHLVLERPVATVYGPISACLRAGDVVGEYSPNELEILLVDPSLQGQLAVPQLEADLVRNNIAARVGSAWYPRDGRESVALTERARARAHGSVFEHVDPDVVIVDDRMLGLHKLIARVATTDITVLLLGETGVGKEVLAEMLHRCSKRADKPFLRVNCAALTETLLESELFGHERGAFTGAMHAKPGLFEVAEGGVLFLDEVGELLPSTQSKLLRVLDERKVIRVGGIKPKSIDVRLVAATNRDLEAEVERGNFRLDLMYRLNAMSIVVPPLRERVGEIEPLARAFARTFAGRLQRPVPRISPSAMALLQSYSWPGNVRELRNVIERAVILCADDEIGPSDLPTDKLRSTFAIEQKQLLESRVNAAGLAGTPGEAAGDDERQRVIAALEACAGNQTHAAKLLGISRRTLITRIEKFAVPRPRKR